MNRPRYCEGCWEKGDHAILATVRGKDRDGIMRELCAYHAKQEYLLVEAAPEPKEEVRAPEQESEVEMKTEAEKHICEVDGCGRQVRRGRDGVLHAKCGACRCGSRPGYRPGAPETKTPKAKKPAAANKSVQTPATPAAEKIDKIAIQVSERNLDHFWAELSLEQKAGVFGIFLAGA